MSVNVNYCDTFLNAVLNSYTAGSFVRTLGFFAPGDGGAAVYKISQELPDADKTISTTVAGVTFTYGEGKFYKTNSTVFELIPQGNTVYAEQFGVLPGGVAFAEGNIKMLSRAIAFAAQNGFVLTFASGGVYYLKPGSIYVPSGMHIDGNGATLQIYGESDSGVDLFALSSTVNNVSIRNITLIGRRTAGESGYLDQGIHIKGTNLNVKNVSFKYFFIAIHTYGGDEVQYDTDTETDTETETDTDTENKTYIIADIPNKNWLIDSCKTESCVFGIITSEIDGLVIKDSDISCYTTSNDTAHCVYLSSNCSNIRVAGCSLHDVSGDAIHKVYPYSEKLDLSKNHFYTDLSIHYADSALDIDFISRNVMCDNVFATEVAIALELSAADNCIVSNSYFSQTRATGDMKAFIYAKKACNCWLQNSYVYYKGQHRVTYEYQKSNMLSTVFADKKHRRMFVGPIFDIPNHWFKFTGCEFKSDTEDDNKYYFSGAYDLEKAVFHEYWDNCKVTYCAPKDFFRFMCINTIPEGLTVRNSYLKSVSTDTDIGAPFRFQCGQGNCNCLTEDTCPKKQLGKRFPFVRYENNILDRFYYPRTSTVWGYHVSTFYADAHDFTIPEAVAISGSYVSGVYRLRDGIFSKMKDLDKSGPK